MPWDVVRFAEAASEFHGRDVSASRSVWVCEVTGPAVVLGSAQRSEVVDADACAEAGVEVVKRRSGGGAVLVVPRDLLWVDVVLPSTDPLWQADVGKAFHWLGEVWQSALAELGVTTTVHRGGLERSEWSDLVCFAGLGPGELLTADGAKVVGLSQRRTREAARFQCAALARWDPAALVALLAVDRDPAGLADVATGVGVDLEDLLAAFLRALP